MLTVLLLVSLIKTASAQYTKLFDFSRDTTGSYPFDGLVSDGTYFYGLTHLGGAKTGGSLFKIKHDGTGFSKLLDFSDTASGRNPDGILYYDGTYLYGSTFWGGTYDGGTLFKIKTNGSDYQKLYDFDGATGKNPSRSLISDGTYLYGVTENGGANGDGTIYRIKPDGSGFAVLMSFERLNSGMYPNGALYTDGTYLYGVTKAGGSSATVAVAGHGTIFKIKKDGTGYVKLLDFEGQNGSGPNGSLISDGAFLYGMTYQGGAMSAGTVFKIKPNGKGFSTLLEFTVTTNAWEPSGSLILSGNKLYGMSLYGGDASSGVVFKINTDGNGFKKLWEFSDSKTGNFPYGNLLLLNNYLYGTTYNGGKYKGGVIFKLDTASTSTLHAKSYQKTASFQLYPNPVLKQFTISVFDQATMDITDIHGQVLLTRTLAPGQSFIDVETLPAGIYFVTVKTDTGIETRKIVKE